MSQVHFVDSDRDIDDLWKPLVESVAKDMNDHSVAFWKHTTGTADLRAVRAVGSMAHHTGARVPKSKDATTSDGIRVQSPRGRPVAQTTRSPCRRRASKTSPSRRSASRRPPGPPSLFTASLSPAAIRRTGQSEAEDADRWCPSSCRKGVKHSDELWFEDLDASACPRAIRSAVARMHINLAHAVRAELVKLLASHGPWTAGLLAANALRCATCLRSETLRHPRPSRLPHVGQSHEWVTMDVMHTQDLAGNPLKVLGMIDTATLHHAVSVLPDRKPSTIFEVVPSRPDGHAHHRSGRLLHGLLFEWYQRPPRRAPVCPRGRTVAVGHHRMPQPHVALHVREGRRRHRSHDASSSATRHDESDSRKELPLPPQRPISGHGGIQPHPPSTWRTRKGQGRILLLRHERALLRALISTTRHLDPRRSRQGLRRTRCEFPGSPKHPPTDSRPGQAPERSRHEGRVLLHDDAGGRFKRAGTYAKKGGYLIGTCIGRETPEKGNKHIIQY